RRRSSRSLGAGVTVAVSVAMPIAAAVPIAIAIAIAAGISVAAQCSPGRPTVGTSGQRACIMHAIHGAFNHKWIWIERYRQWRCGVSDHRQRRRGEFGYGGTAAGTELTLAAQNDSARLANLDLHSIPVPITELPSCR